jgi:hypothetical protein
MGRLIFVLAVLALFGLLYGVLSGDLATWGTTLPRHPLEP